mgnify:FL=1|jgi:hypothetical protein
MLFQLDGIWFAAGVTVGLLLSSVVIPPRRTVSRVPDPMDEKLVYHTDTGCVRVEATEVPCTSETDSFNLLASLKK